MIEPEFKATQSDFKELGTAQSTLDLYNFLYTED